MTQTLTTDRQQFEQWWHEEYCHLEGSNEAAFVKHVAWEAMQKAREILANREAQPVGYIAEVSGNRVGVLRGLPLPDVGSLIYTAPPAPAVPTFEEWLLTQKNKPLGWVRDSMKESYDACRAAMLAQPVSQGYKLPDGFKLMPIEMTDEIGEAIALEARCCGGIALCIYEAALAAAPEGGNG